MKRIRAILNHGIKRDMSWVPSMLTCIMRSKTESTASDQHRNAELSSEKTLTTCTAFGRNSSLEHSEGKLRRQSLDEAGSV